MQRPIACRMVGLTLMLAVPSVGCGVMQEEPMPPVPRPAIFQEPSACVAVPPPPFEPPERAPLDPRKCLVETGSRRALPVELSITDGHVTSFVFYNPCSGERPQVTPALRECVHQALATWRYPLGPTCPGEHSSSYDILVLEPLGAPLLALSDVKHGCSG